MRKSIKKLIAVASASVMALTLAITAVPTGTDAATKLSKAGKQAAKKEFDPSGSTTYHAYFGMQQTESWIFRDEWYAEANGLGGSKIPDGSSYEGTLYQSGTNGNEPLAGVTVTDAEITGNGVYTVGVEGLNGILTQAETNDQAQMSMLYVTTDIPTTAMDKVTISDWKLSIDGSDQALPTDVFFPDEYLDNSGLIDFHPFNSYQRDQGEYPECPSIKTPNDSVKITFTVSGFDNDNPDAVEATPEPAKDDSASSSSDSDSSSSSESSGGLSGGAVAAIVIVVVVVIAAIVIAVKRKKD